LCAAFRPKGEICVLRALSRQREMLAQYQGRHVQHMQKALAQMNLQLANVISDIAGQTGLKILRAIIAGERNPVALASLRHERIRASEAEIVKSLQGNWREEHLFALKQALELYDAYARSLDECDRQLAAHLAGLACHEPPAERQQRRARRRRDPAPFDLRLALFRVCGVDLTRIDGIDTGTALKMLAEVGPDLSRFKSAKHFASWLGLCPGTKISGGKLLSGASKRTANRLAQALRLAAVSLRNSKSALGAYYRRLCARLDKPKAVRATAHKLARLIYTLLTKGTEYLDRGQAYYEERYQQRVLHHLNRKAAAMGFKLMPIDTQPA
jgi:transposase